MIDLLRPAESACREIDGFVRRARTPRHRSMLDFAEQEVVIPDGPFEGRKFRSSRQPYTRLWFLAIGLGLWTKFFATGPTQSGKTLACFLVPLLYHLFEIGETVICGLPTLDMAADKWREDILPVIERTRYRDRLPIRGDGSRGGSKLDAIKFRHGPTLKFMGGGGGDKARAGFTSRVVVITETDGLDEAGGSSREADKVTQLIGRTRAYGSRARIYAECTVSIEAGRTWQEYTKGTQSRIALPCVHCGTYVTPGREHLVGWRDSETVLDARECTHFVCPACSEPWNEEDRRSSNAAGVLVQRGQDVDASGVVIGAAPRTDTLGFRWSAVNNLFVKASDIGGDEHAATKVIDEDNAEKELLQFVWALPHKPAISELTALDPDRLMRHTTDVAKGMVPADADLLTVAIDIGKYLCHYTTLAWRDGASGHVVEHERFEVPSDQIEVDRAIITALREFRDTILLTGWARSDGKLIVPRQVWIDSGWKPDVVYLFCRESNGLVGDNVFMPTKGYGSGQDRNLRYARPKKKTTLVRHVGEAYHISRLKAKNTLLVEVDANHWKSWLHERLAAPADTPGSLSLYRAMPNEHRSFVKHLTAERKVEEFVPGKGAVTRWEVVRRANHWLDSTYNACCAAHFCGVRLIDEDVPSPTKKVQEPTATMTGPGGEAYLITERRC